MPGGGLPVPNGQDVLPVIRRVHELFPRESRYATRDLHPMGHISLASSYIGIAPMTQLGYITAMNWTQKNHPIAKHAKFTLRGLQDYLKEVGSQILWPDHAIVGTKESEIHKEIQGAHTHVVDKGLDPVCDSYSGFYDNLGHETRLCPCLHVAGIKRIFLTGLAFDVCVGHTAIDAKVKAGFDEVFVIIDATAAIDMETGVKGMRSVEHMMKKLLVNGVKLIHSYDLATM